MAEAQRQMAAVRKAATWTAQASGQEGYGGRYDLPEGIEVWMERRLRHHHKTETGKGGKECQQFLIRKI